VESLTNNANDDFNSFNKGMRSLFCPKTCVFYVLLASLSSSPKSQVVKKRRIYMRWQLVYIGML
jgi:hypothetical protein